MYNFLYFFLSLVHSLCIDETTSTVFGMDMTWFVMIVVSILLIISAAIVGITICVCRRQEETNNQHNTAMQCKKKFHKSNICYLNTIYNPASFVF